MAYRIEYQPEDGKRYPGIQKKKYPIKRLIKVTIVILVFTVCIARRDALFAFLIPGDQQITVTAFNNMVCQIEDGISVGDALFTFCREIVDGARP